MKTIITYGTFDLFHIGHLNLLRRAKELGDYLIVGLSTDTFNQIKNKFAIFSYAQRRAILSAIRYVDLVIPETNWEQKVTDIKNFEVDMLVMGDDWKTKFNYLRKYCSVKYLTRTRDISTTLIKQQIFIGGRI